MSLEKVSDILKMADKANTSVLAFNSSDFNMVYSLINVAQELKKPVICVLDPAHARNLNWTTPKVYAEMVKALAKDKSVPIGLHMDHCSDPEYIISAVKDGFTSVMYDGSMLPVEENIQITKSVVEQAHKLGADVEAELGHVGFTREIDHQKDADKYTNPEVAKAFCEQSGCDSLAIAIGSAHGFYKETPKLDISRLIEINAITDIPLVLHGGSGIPEDQLAIAFKEGINKFNVGTEYFWLYFQSLKSYLNSPDADFFRSPIAVHTALEEYLRKKLQLCTMTV